MEYLVVSVQGPQHIDIWQKITKLASDNDCHVQHAQGHRVAGENALTALMAGNWNTIAKLETAIKSLCNEQPKLLVTLNRSKPLTDQMPSLPYSVQVIALDELGILHHICRFFSENAVTIESLQFDSFKSTATQAPMFSLTVSLAVPSNTNIGDLREQFMIFCDELNIDGIIEPEKR